MNQKLEQEFEISGEYIELIKLLKAAGICQTGGHAKLVVGDGEVKLNGEIETRKKRKIRKGDCVEFETHRLTVT
jgi:ribosome-associated protein